MKKRTQRAVFACVLPALLCAPLSACDKTEKFGEGWVYSENIPETGDRYWQSDKANGKDIFDFENPAELFATDGQYWHKAFGESVAWEKIRVLFIGNSFTYTNNVPEIFDHLAEDLGYYVETYSITGPGWYLLDHAKAEDTCGRQIDALLNARSDFDFVILQEQSTRPYEDHEAFEEGVRNLKEKIEATQDHAKIYLYATWGYPSVAEGKGWTVPEMEGMLREAYMNAAAEMGLGICPVGTAFTEIFEHESNINLYDTDRKHQSYEGSYLSACVHAATILGADVENTLYRGNIKDDDVLFALRSAAAKSAR